MTAGRAILAILAALCAGTAAADAYEDRLLRLDLPGGYDGPVSASQNASMSVVAFRWTGSAGATPTLLQITETDLGSTAVEIPAEERGKAAEKYLLQLLDGVARRRSSFETSGPSRLELGGLPGAKISWQGTTLDRRLSGVMYCVVVGMTVVSFHTQDFEPAPHALRDAIVRAIESMALIPRTAEDRRP